MRIVITGASGHIGKNIIPYLAEAGVEMVLLTRNVPALRAIYGDRYSIKNYANLAQTFAGADAILHLAIMNNNNDASLDEYRNVNVLFLRQVLDAAKEALVEKVIYTTSFHVVDNEMTNYAISKKDAEELLNERQSELIINILRLPAVYSEGSYSGKLDILNKFPKKVSNLLFSIISSFKPTVHVRKLADRVISILSHSDHSEQSLSDRQIGNWVYNSASRAIDIVFAISIILLFWWLILIVWLLVKCTTPGPGLFAQVRIGLAGKQFTCYKFRTMHLNTESVGTHEVSPDSVTDIGKIIRKFKVDELPQVWNILLNQMSLVGPRPCLPTQVDLINARHKRGVLDVKCGLTGLSQTMNVDMSEPERLAELDEKYVINRSIPFDIKIILLTFIGAGRGDRVKIEK